MTDTNGRVETAEEFAEKHTGLASEAVILAKKIKARDAAIRADQRKTTAGEVLDRVSFKIHSEYTYTGADVLQALGDLRREYAQEAKMENVGIRSFNGDELAIFLAAFYVCRAIESGKAGLCREGE